MSAGKLFQKAGNATGNALAPTGERQTGWTRKWLEDEERSDDRLLLNGLENCWKAIIFLHGHIAAINFRRTISFMDVIGLRSQTSNFKCWLNIGSSQISCEAPAVIRRWVSGETNKSSNSLGRTIYCLPNSDVNWITTSRHLRCGNRKTVSLEQAFRSDR